MRVISCLLLAALAVFASARSLENEELLQKIERILNEEEASDAETNMEHVETSMKHQQEVGEALVSRSLETRGKKKNKNKGGNSGGTGGDSGGDNNTPKAPAGVTQYSKINVIKGGKASSVTVKDSMLAAHNFVRKIHGVSPLTWDSSLAASSQAHADKMAAAGKIFHSDTGGKYGENVGYKGISVEGTVYTPSFICFSWYIECKKYSYNYNSEKNNAKSGHFTQVVWEGTKTVGCGVSVKNVNGMENTYVVCQYQPPGNYLGQYMKNVHANKEPVPLEAKPLQVEGCADYCDICPQYKGMCSQYDFVAEACCDTCK